MKAAARGEPEESDDWNPHDPLLRRTQEVCTDSNDSRYSGVVEVRRAASNELDVCHEIRRRVFIEGQQVPIEADLDGLDAEAAHFLAFEGAQPVGNARLREISPKVAKVERVAVLASHRGRGIGDLLMDAVEREARARGCREIVLNAQLSVVPFYERRKYVGEGEVFEDAGIDHLHMRRKV